LQCPVAGGVGGAQSKGGDRYIQDEWVGTAAN
jgi:hypothetical protein